MRWCDPTPSGGGRPHRQLDFKDSCYRLAVLVAVLAGLLSRQNWVRWVFVALTVVQFNPLCALTDRFVPGWAASIGGLGYMQSALQLVAVILLLLPVSEQWFRKLPAPSSGA